MKTIFLNVALALILFGLNAILGKIQYGFNGKPFAYGKFHFAVDEGETFAGNFFLKIVNPTIFMAISCSVVQRLFSEEICQGLWLLVPFFWIIRMIYIFVKNRVSIINWTYELFAAALSLTLAQIVFWAMIIPLVDADESIFISITELRDAVWYAIIAYIATSVWSIGKKRFSGDVLYPAEKRKKIILNRYTRFSEKYGALILDCLGEKWFKSIKEKGEFTCLVYAVMIYEDYNRPRLYRFGERIVKRFGIRKEMTLGIMQVKTNQLISDQRSIEIAVEKLFQAYLNNIDDEPIEAAINDYNFGAEYREEVLAINEVLQEEVLCLDQRINESEMCMD